MSLRTFTDAYIEAMLWSTNDESTEQGGEPFDNNYGPEDFDEETRARIVDDCKVFYAYLQLEGDELDAVVKCFPGQLFRDDALRAAVDRAMRVNLDPYEGPYGLILPSIAHTPGRGLDAQAGHDFWLTRVGHGTGFWDRPEWYQPPYAENFTAIAEAFGDFYIYVYEGSMGQNIIGSNG